MDKDTIPILVQERYKAEFNEPIANGLSKMINTALVNGDWKMIINIEAFCNFLTYDEQKEALHKIFFK